MDCVYFFVFFRVLIARWWKAANTHKRSRKKRSKKHKSEQSSRIWRLREEEQASSSFELGNQKSTIFLCAFVSLSSSGSFSLWLTAALSYIYFYMYKFSPRSNRANINYTVELPFLITHTRTLTLALEFTIFGIFFFGVRTNWLLPERSEECDEPKVVSFCRMKHNIKITERTRTCDYWQRQLSKQFYCRNLFLPINKMQHIRARVWAVETCHENVRVDRRMQFIVRNEEEWVRPGIVIWILSSHDEERLRHSIRANECITFTSF